MCVSAFQKLGSILISAEGKFIAKANLGECKHKHARVAERLKLDFVWERTLFWLWSAINAVIYSMVWGIYVDIKVQCHGHFVTWERLFGRAVNAFVIVIVCLYDMPSYWK